MSTFTDIRNYYFKHFRHKPVYVKAPGRINLAGEHLDYNLGFALPSAIDRYVYFAASKNGEQSLVRIYSVDYNEYFEANTLQLAPIKYHWSNYITGVIQMLQMYSGRSISGFDVVFGGDLPRGAGLSSSAAVECGMAVTLCHLFGIEIDRMQLAKLCLQAEHEFAGVKCGLLDQFSSLFGKAGFVMSINFKTLNYRYIPLNMDGFSVLMFNTNKPHTLAEGNEFNKRVASCRQGVEALQQHIVNIDCLCDASPGQLNEVKANLDEVSFDRCTYIVEENIRYHQALKALEENNMVLFGKLLFDTHNGLKSLYGISCKELDLLIDYAKGNSNILGAKLMGGGYGGCTINIVKSDSVDQISREVTELYNNASPYRLQVYNVRSADGAEILKSET